MSLAAYQKKRKFKETPEPKGKKGSSTGPLTFVIQKHRATQLHYDFRLEIGGVFVSWAVPKGPTLDPAERRLAMHVEDHPMDYADFEGIIPKKNYGAGTVMVWDQGVYMPYGGGDRAESEKILAEQLAKGHLTFIMLGEKLKGEFALVKIQKADDDSWLLLKKGDEYASDIDILDQDRSVLTGRSMEEIAGQAQKKDEIWYSTPRDLDLAGAAKEAFPHQIKPMLAQVSEEPFDNSDWLFEMKWDGYRVISEIDSGTVRLYSRNQLSYNEKFAPIADSLTRFPGNAVLDGEVVVVDSSGKPKFQWLQDYPKGSTGELIYYVFDLLHYDGRNIRELPLTKRKDLLRHILPPLPHVLFSHHIQEQGVEFFKQTSDLGLEGIIAKKVDSSYILGARSQSWLKIKSMQRQEAVIAGYTAPKGGRSHFGALVLGVYENGKLRYIGHAGGGFNEKRLAEVYAKLKPLEQEQCPFATRPMTNAPVTWVKPVLLCEVMFREWTAENHMRHPLFVGLREDKSATQVVDERIFSRESPDKKNSKTFQIGSQRVKLANPTKVFWPDENITKLDLVTFYRSIAPVLLPHLKDRPQSLLRYPDGIKGEGFFQKDTYTLLADWIQKVIVHSDSGDKDVEYMLCQDEAALVYMLNLGCIDLNPWNSRVGHLENPDYLILDLDPEDTPFTNVIKTALEIRRLLEELDIPSYPKTSGSRGIHVYIPMGAQYSYEQTRQLAELLCIQIHHRLPHITSLVRNPADRQGKVYLDYLQNARGQTLVSVYSVRPKPGATVSTPLKWDEVTKKLHPSQFTIHNVPDRVHKYGDLFKGAIGKGIDMAKVLRKIEKLVG